MIKTRIGRVYKTQHTAHLANKKEAACKQDMAKLKTETGRARRRAEIQKQKGDIAKE